jgi:hypothetical protein
MEWDGIFYQPHIWLYLAFLVPLCDPDSLTPSAVPDSAKQAFSFGVLAALLGLTKVLDLKGIRSFIEAIPPSTIAQWLALAIARGPHTLALSIEGLDLVVELLENPWLGAPEDELRRVLEELAETFTTITEVNVPGALRTGLRFFVFFLEKGIYCEEDRPLMEWLFLARCRVTSCLSDGRASLPSIGGTLDSMSWFARSNARASSLVIWA